MNEDNQKTPFSLISQFSHFFRPDPNRNEIFQYKFKIPINKNEIKLEPKLLQNEENKKIIDNETEIHNETENSKILPSGLPKELENNKERIPLFIFIYLKNDSEQEINKLNLTLKSLENNLMFINQYLGINPKQIFIIIFLENILETKNIHYLFPGLSDDQITLEEESKRQIFNCNILYYDFTHKKSDLILNETLNICCVFKKDISVFEAQKVFLLGFCNEMKKTEEVFFSLFLENGLELEKSSLSKMIISLTYNNENANFTLNDNRSFAVKGLIEPTSHNFGIFAQAQQYEYFHRNTYDLNSFQFDLSNKFSMYKINQKVLNMLINYYNSNKDLTDIHFHNQLLPNQLIKEDFDTIFIPYCQANFNNTDFGFSDIMEDYTDHLTANFHMFFTNLFSLFNCKNYSKNYLLFTFINIFNIFSSFINIVLPGLIVFVIYSIFYEAFDIAHYKAVFFFTVLYGFFILVSSYFSLIADRPQELSIIFSTMHIIFTIFYFFILICSFVAIDKVRTSADGIYTFDVAAFVVIIILNLLFGITPIILNFAKYKKHLINQFLYLIGSASSYSSLFLIYSIFKVYKNKKNIHRALFITSFLLCNLFFGYLIMTLDSRPQRVNSILNLSIIFTIYNSFKFGLIIFNYVRYNCFKKKLMNDDSIIENVKNALIQSYQNENNQIKKEENNLNTLGDKKNEEENHDKYYNVEQTAHNDNHDHNFHSNVEDPLFNKQNPKSTPTRMNRYQINQEVEANLEKNQNLEDNNERRMTLNDDQDNIVIEIDE